MVRFILFFSLLATLAFAQHYVPVRDSPPALTREFRGAWIAVVHNIDWPSAKGQSASAQQAELRSMLDKLAATRINAVIFQVRPQCDAVYQSPHEPWSQWLSGSMGKSPGYDPLAFCIREAHARGIEVHAWFNPFRALCNTSYSTTPNHITRAAPHLTKRFSSMVWSDPAQSDARARALRAIMDVVQRYDVDGVHLDDYFYPYPVKGATFNDGKSPAQRRAYIDDFVQNLYSSVKKQKPWVRVGISPFGIWRPGVPAGIEAGIDSYEQLAGDSRKWLSKGWVDYLAPQLYWRISPQKQSFPVLLEWWRQQGSRPVWPGIATSRIESSDDPGRPASEITNQIALSRQIGKNWHGHIHWSAKSLVTNRGGITGKLAGSYTQAAIVPPMPWISRKAPDSPGLGASANGEETRLQWQADDRTARIAIQAKNGGTWRTLRIVPASAGTATIPKADAVAITALCRYGNASAPKVLGLH
jgi:uncharacterized lipoprotein YddW (UPF0748 family)